MHSPTPTYSATSLTPLYDWYQREKRDLPWRETRDAYKIWLSEIILQQTRVAQGLDYYLRFTMRFPTLRDLAEASEDEVLKLWQGLGYYSRARNLLKAARVAYASWSEIPDDYERLRTLPGVGDYTAAAIASFAFDLPHAVVDGNVFRVLSRLYADFTPIDSTQGKKRFAELAHRILDRQHPALHNQAMMELGALVCAPSEPHCDACPLAELCQARARETQNELPVKTKKTAKRTRYFNYLYLSWNESDGAVKYALHRRGKGDIWAGLYEPPLIESDRPLTRKELIMRKEFQRFFPRLQNVIWQGEPVTFTHLLTHQRIEATFHVLTIQSANDFVARDIVIVNEKDLDNYAVSRLTDKLQSLLPSRQLETMRP